jgi:hypothetical protein
MKIETITVTASASKNYQKYDVSLSASDITNEDIAKLQAAAIAASLNGINALCAAMPATPSTAEVYTSYKTSSYGKNQFRANPNAPATASQLKYLNSLHVTEPLDNLTMSQANALIKKYKVNPDEN